MNGDLLLEMGRAVQNRNVFSWPVTIVARFRPKAVLQLLSKDVISRHLILCGSSLPCKNAVKY